jgi:hypothetical protein
MRGWLRVGARFTDPAETAALRDLRAKVGSPNADFPVVDAGKGYVLYFRDELPDDVVKALDKLGVPLLGGQ